jgi:hypothetical protein
MKDKRPFIESAQVVPKESIFEAGYVPRVEYRGFTTDMMTRKARCAVLPEGYDVEPVV